jgi:hypothetical protein
MRVVAGDAEGELMHVGLADDDGACRGLPTGASLGTPFSAGARLAGSPATDIVLSRSHATSGLQPWPVWWARWRRGAGLIERDEGVQIIAAYAIAAAWCALLALPAQTRASSPAVGCP